MIGSDPQTVTQLNLPPLPESINWISDLHIRLIEYFVNYVIKRNFPGTVLGIDKHQFQKCNDSTFSTAYSEFYSSSDWKSKISQLSTLVDCQWDLKFEQYLTQIVPSIKDFFQPYGKTTIFHIYPKITYRHLVIYPWLVLGNLLMSLEIQTPNISKLALQVAVLRSNNIPISNVIIFNPMIPTGLIWNISEWDHRPLLQELSLNKVYSTPDLNLNQKLVGRVISTESIADIYMALNSWVTNCLRNRPIVATADASHPQIETDNKTISPTQIYIGHSVSLHELLNDHTFETCRQLVSKYKIPLFIHSSFRANISRARTGTFVWLIDGVKRALLYGQKIGASGVVVHTGSHVKMDPKIGLVNMRDNIKYLLQFATPKCPLLLETPAGKGTQQLITLKELVDFYSMICQLDPSITGKFKICVDTCHVHDVGYQPIDYLSEFHKLAGTESIGLIHLNDSETPLGGRRDRHAYPGCGYIGSEMLQQVVIWGNRYSIPMVIEA